MLLNRLPLNMLPPRAVLLAADVVLLSLPEGEGADARFLSGREPPYGTVAVRSASAPYQIAAIRLSDHSGEERPQAHDPDAVDPLNPVVLGSDIAELAEELDAPSQRRLLAFLLGFCRKAFVLAEHPDFAASCLRLARLCVPEAGLAEPVATVTAAWTVLGLRAPPDASLFVLSTGRVRRSAAPSLSSHSALRLVERVAEGDVLLALGEQPALWTAGPARTGLPDLVRSQPDAAGLRASCLRALAPICPLVAAHLREASVLAPAAPRRHDDAARPIGAGLEAALPDGEGRIFLRGWMRDPMRLIASAELTFPSGATPLEVSRLHRFRRPDLEQHFARAAFSDPEPRTGFVAHLPDPSAGLSLQPTLSLRLHSGARLEVRPPLRHPTASAARTAVLTSVPPEDVTDAMLDGCLGPAAAAFHRRSLEARGKPDRIQIGAPVGDPAVSIIVPLYRNLSFLRFQLAALAGDQECRTAELIFVLDSPEQRGEAEHLLRGLHAMHGMPLTLLVMPRNLGYAAANNEGAAHACAPALLLLNSDVVPAGPGWLGRLNAAIDAPGIAAAGPKLLFDDESIQHAGLFFQRDPDGMWLNAHYHKGMPRAWPAADQPRRVPGVTGAALLVHRRLFEAVGGICEDYIVGDYEDSDFCLRLHESGARTTYVPAAELFHFERRSIGLHKGYAGTLACRYNRRLHHQRWDEAIAALMSEPEFRPLVSGAAA
jgi:GT2 family glycosyltransferase